VCRERLGEKIAPISCHGGRKGNRRWGWPNVAWVALRSWVGPGGDVEGQPAPACDRWKDALLSTLSMGARALSRWKIINRIRGIVGYCSPLRLLSSGFLRFAEGRNGRFHGPMFVGASKGPVSGGGPRPCRISLAQRPMSRTPFGDQLIGRKSRALRGRINRLKLLAADPSPPPRTWPLVVTEKSQNKNRFPKVASALFVAVRFQAALRGTARFWIFGQHFPLVGRHQAGWPFSRQEYSAPVRHGGMRKKIRAAGIGAQLMVLSRDRLVHSTRSRNVIHSRRIPGPPTQIRNEMACLGRGMAKPP